MLVLQTVQQLPDCRMLTRDEGVKGMTMRLKCVGCPGGASGSCVGKVRIKAGIQEQGVDNQQQELQHHVLSK